MKDWGNKKNRKLVDSVNVVASKQVAVLGNEVHPREEGRRSR